MSCIAIGDTGPIRIIRVFLSPRGKLRSFSVHGGQKKLMGHNFLGEWVSAQADTMFMPVGKTEILIYLISPILKKLLVLKGRDFLSDIFRFERPPPILLYFNPLTPGVH